jgi:hypothetical protein
LEKTEEPYDLPEGDPLTLASYVATEPVDIYLEHPAVGASLPEMPLFLRPDRYINVPLEATYQEAYRSLPEFWRDVLEQCSVERQIRAKANHTCDSHPAGSASHGRAAPRRSRFRLVCCHFYSGGILEPLITFEKGE